MGRGRLRIVIAAMIFGRQFEDRVAERSADLGEDGLQRLLLDLMSGGVAEFARIEVLDAYGESGRPLDELLQEAVYSRRDREVRSKRQGP